jgi:transmembrane sensor
MTHGQDFDDMDWFSRIERYERGSVPATERVAVEAYLRAYPEATRFVATLRTELSGDGGAGFDPVRGLHRLEAMRAVHRPVHQTARIQRRRSTRWHIAALWSAACVAVTAIGLFTYRAAVPARARFAQGAIYRTEPASMRAITLPDGSRIVLAPQTTLQLDPNFGRSTRTMTLRGEAHFVVASAHDIPFIVRTGEVTTRVLGTTFRIRHYAGDALVQLTVVSGKVETRNRNRPVQLAAGTMAYVTDSTIRTMSAEPTHADLAWTRGELVFRNTPVPELLQTVGHWYGVEFRASDSSLVRGRVTLTLDRKTEAEAIAVLESALDVTLVSDSRSHSRRILTLHPKSSVRAPNRSQRRDTFSIHTEAGK